MFYDFPLEFRHYVLKRLRSRSSNYKFSCLSVSESRNNRSETRDPLFTCLPTYSTFEVFPGKTLRPLNPWLTRRTMTSFTYKVNKGFSQSLCLELFTKFLRLCFSITFIFRIMESDLFSLPLWHEFYWKDKVEGEGSIGRIWHQYFRVRYFSKNIVAVYALCTIKTIRNMCLQGSTGTKPEWVFTRPRLSFIVTFNQWQTFLTIIYFRVQWRVMRKRHLHQETTKPTVWGRGVSELSFTFCFLPRTSYITLFSFSVFIFFISLPLLSSSSFFSRLLFRGIMNPTVSYFDHKTSVSSLLKSRTYYLKIRV